MLLISACANIVPPTGGPRDTTAPELVNSASADSVLNFKGGNIVLEFDEYVKLANVQKNFDISPLTPVAPKITVKKKRVIVSLPDSILEKNTTYTLDFGDAVQDLKESNAYKNLRITLSTGSYFDSLSLNGNITDAASGERDTIRVMLYPADMPDSMLLKQRPLYVAKAVNGAFSFTGLPSKEFKIAALSDRNANYIYDSRGEKIAFLDKKVDPQNPDSALILYSFIEEKMVDTAQQNGSGRFGKKRGRQQGAPLSYTLDPDVKTAKKFDPQDTLRIEIKDTNAVVDISKIRFYENEALDLSVQKNFDDSTRIISIIPVWKTGMDYSLVLQENFLTDTSSKGSPVDTINFRSFSKEDYGVISVVLDTALYQPGAVLMVYQKDALIKKAPARLDPVTFSDLKPQPYTLRLLYDKNNNGVWDSGDLEKRLQPEITIALPQNIKLKPNWEETVEWKLGSKKKRMGK